MNGTLVAVLASCPGCGAASGGEPAAGLLWGALFLMVVPYLVVALIGGGLFLAYRREIRDEVARLLRSVDRTPADTVAGRER